MPSIKTITPILGGSYYHIFNRGSNRQSIFYTPGNYTYFLKLLHQFLGNYVQFLAYALLPNHFHLILKVNDEISVEQKGNKGNRSLEEENGSFGSFSIIKDENEVGKAVVRQLKRMFITYAVAINKQENRVGNLFDPKYKRLEITNQEYLFYAIFYTHFNPEKHGLTDNFKNYRYSSFKAFLGSAPTNINRKLVFEIFGDFEDFVNYHNGWHEERSDIELE